MKPEQSYHRLVVHATDPRTEFWLVDDHWHPVQKAKGVLDTSVMAGRYFVDFYPDDPAGLVYPIELWSNQRLYQVDLELGRGCQRQIARGYVEEDKLEGYWKAIIWWSLLIPCFGGWVIVVLSSVMYYVWLKEYPNKAKSINRHGWLAWLTGQALGILVWLLLSQAYPNK